MSVAATDKVKWDGAGLPVSGGLPVGVIAEFAGGLSTHTTRKKQCDNTKMITNAQKVADVSLIHGAGKVFCVLAHGMYKRTSKIPLCETK